MKVMMIFDSTSLVDKQGMRPLTSFPSLQLFIHFLLFSMFEKKNRGRTDGLTDRQTDRQTDTPSYRDARMHLKNEVSLESHKTERDSLSFSFLSGE